MFENTAHWTSYKRNFLATVEIKDENVMIYGKHFLDQPIKNDIRTYDNVQKITTDQGDDYTAGYLLDYVYFKHYCKMIAIDLIKQQALDADPKAVKQINFAGNVDKTGSTKMFFITEEAKETIFHFPQGAVREL